MHPFIDNISFDYSCFKHLEYAGCGSSQPRVAYLETLLKWKYPGLFWRGITIHEMNRLIDVYRFPKSLFTPSLHNPALYQLGGIDRVDWERKLARYGNLGSFAFQIERENLMEDDEVKKFIINRDSAIKILFDFWNNSARQHFNLTTVGIAIAHANTQRKMADNYELHNWIG